jgi:DNA-binding response OmpR family regulator
VEDRIRGLDAGADDYLAKPFSMSELLARLRAVLRRQRAEPVDRLRIADLELDLLSRTAHRGGEKIALTNREFALLEVLMLSAPKPVSKTAIVEHVWDQHFDSGTNVVNVYVNYLREKIDRPGWPPLIHTVRGVGFALREPAP